MRGNQSNSGAQWEGRQKQERGWRGRRAQARWPVTVLWGAVLATFQQGHGVPRQL